MIEMPFADTASASPRVDVSALAPAGTRWMPILILSVLTAALTLSYADRFLIAVLAQPIKAELHLSDTELGLLMGFAFSVFYAVMGLALARLADRGHRRAVAAGSVGAWSLMTAFTGALHGIVQMGFACFGVGAGEAGVFPTGHALVADTFVSGRRNSAMAIFSAGGSFGLLIAFAVGAWLGARLSWRWTFVAMAVPGALVALLACIVLPGGGKAGSRLARGRPIQDFLSMWRNPPFRHLPIAQSAVVVLMCGQAQWLPAFFVRSFGVKGEALGVSLGLTPGRRGNRWRAAGRRVVRLASRAGPHLATQGVRAIS